MTAADGVRPEPLKAPFTPAQAKASQEAWAKYLKKKVIEEVTLTDGVTMEFILIPPGTYKRGTSAKDVKRLVELVKDSTEERWEDETLQVEVTITHPFYLAKYPVTQAQFKAIIRWWDQSYFDADTDPVGEYKERIKGMNTRRFPVDYVSWKDAVKFCDEVKRKTDREVGLPREAEWEYAYRAGTETFYYFGDKLNGDKANCNGTAPFGTSEKGEYLRRTCTVGSYSANAFGLYDMAGNVSQWCEDYYGPYEGLATKDPVRTEPYVDANRMVYDCRALRGGSWINFAHYCRAAFRDRGNPGTRYYGYGFRPCIRLK
jgi:formylglycine-generating enzyme required for sulfatase activity